MKYRSVLSPDAQADFASAVRWYQLIDRTLAFRFRLETLAILHRIKRFPYQFAVKEGITRRALLKRFPYSMYFNLNGEEVSVIAVVRQRRSETIWRDRANRANKRGP